MANITVNIDWMLMEHEHKVRGRILQVAHGVVGGKKYPIIAHELGLEVPSVRTYYERLCALLGVERSHSAVICRLYDLTIERMQENHRKEIEALKREIEGLKAQIAAMQPPEPAPVPEARMLPPALD